MVIAIVVIDVPVARIGIISDGKSNRLNKKTKAGTKITPLPIPKKPERRPANMPNNIKPRKNSNM
jgi:hypothetical protein|tara:strand:+ start:592 stop:786 length:195 start_codon:yes stop_codon:yes gene_type:complete